MTEKLLANFKSKEAKIKHNEIEMNRRKKMSSLIQELSLLLPSKCFHGKRKPDKLAILKAAGKVLKQIQIIKNMESPFTSSSSFYKSNFDVISGTNLKNLLLECTGGFLMLVLKPQGRVIYVSPNVQSLLGISQENIYAGNILSMVHPRDKSCLGNLLYSSLSSYNADNKGCVIIRMRLEREEQNDNKNDLSVEYLPLKVTFYKRSFVCEDPILPEIFNSENLFSPNKNSTCNDDKNLSISNKRGCSNLISINNISNFNYTNTDSSNNDAISDSSTSINFMTINNSTCSNNSINSTILYNSTINSSSSICCNRSISNDGDGPINLDTSSCLVSFWQPFKISTIEKIEKTNLSNNKKPNEDSQNNKNDEDYFTKEQNEETKEDEKNFKSEQKTNCQFGAKLNLDGVFTFVDTRSILVTGFKNIELLGKQISLFCHHGDHNFINNIFQSIKDSKNQFFGGILRFKNQNTDKNNKNNEKKEINKKEENSKEKFDDFVKIKFLIEPFFNPYNQKPEFVMATFEQFVFEASFSPSSHFSPYPYFSDSASFFSSSLFFTPSSSKIDNPRAIINNNDDKNNLKTDFFSHSSFLPCSISQSSSPFTSSCSLFIPSHISLTSTFNFSDNLNCNNIDPNKLIKNKSKTNYINEYNKNNSYENINSININKSNSNNDNNNNKNELKYYKMKNFNNKWNFFNENNSHKFSLGKPEPPKTQNEFKFQNQYPENYPHPSFSHPFFPNHPPPPLQHPFFPPLPAHQIYQNSHDLNFFHPSCSSFSFSSHFHGCKNSKNFSTPHSQFPFPPPHSSSSCSLPRGPLPTYHSSSLPYNFSSYNNNY